MNPLFVGVKDAARILGICEWTVRQYIDSGRLRPVEMPSTKHPGEKLRRVLIPYEELQAFAATLTRAR